MKRVSILIYSLASGGAERQVSILLNRLSSEYKIYLVLMNDTIFYDIPKNVEIFYLEKSSSFENGVKKLLKLPFLAMKYKKFLKENEIDISLSFMTRPNYTNILAKIFGSRKKTIISERSMFSLQYSYGNLQSKINKKLVKLYNYADLIVSNSYGNMIDLEQKFGIDAKRKVIYNMIDLQQIKKLREENYETKNNRFIFVTIGRLDRGKNHQLSIEAIKDLDCEFWIIGDGYLMDDLKLRIENEGLSDKVKLLGSQKNVYKFLDKADCFVFSSNHEGFPNVLLEALACELPIISTDCKSGPREILAPRSDFTKQATKIELEEFGILIPVGDVKNMKKAMQMMINDKDLKENYKQKALKRVNDFKIEKIVQEWKNFFS